ncbi:hypothetical protein F2P81_023729 [Scophthalmus maximus]|uniref:Uncharacterized protein n=1 Tax=Scophthalmus maximus TaxID=52904 RepID=A0A6A4RS35_SCOMX|nr:hypothetical protein F2P81_023729 [Scophthalmus maximus]
MNCRDPGEMQDEQRYRILLFIPKCITFVPHDAPDCVLIRGRYVTDACRNVGQRRCLYCLEPWSGLNRAVNEVTLTKVSIGTLFEVEKKPTLPIKHVTWQWKGKRRLLHVEPGEPRAA